MECLVYQRIRRDSISSKKIKQAVFFVLRELRKEGQVSVHLVGRRKMRNLNQVYRRQARVTDVLAFAMADSRPRGEERKDLGDIFICLPQARQQAEENKVSRPAEFNRLLIHGLLHLLGYDHLKPEQARKMFFQQDKLWKKIS